MTKRKAWLGIFVIALAAIAFVVPAAMAQSLLQQCQSLPRGADAGLVEYCRGIIANNPSSPSRNPAEAFSHYQKAAELGFAEAQAVLGTAYERGYDTVKPDIAKAVFWYEKAAAQGFAGAQLNLGQLYAKGNGVPRDLAKARALIEAAARQGLAPAQRALAELDRGGAAPPGTEIWSQAVARYNSGDHAGAAKLVQQAAEAGHPTANYEMGYLYEKGDGVPKNLAEALRWYRRGAEMGDGASQAAVGQFYENGWGGVPDDWVQAAQWYTKSAQQENKTGEFRLGRAYQYGIGVPLNLSLAIGWYDKAAAQGDGQAAYFAQYLRDNHGFDGSSRDDQEQAILGPLIGRTLPELAPQGMLFHNTAERLQYVRNLASGEARIKQQGEHDRQQREYDDCRRGGGDSCHPPTTPAPR